MRSPVQEAPTTDFEQLFESIPVPYVVLNRELIVVAMTDAFLEVTMTTRKEMLGKHIFAIFPPQAGQSNARGLQTIQDSLEAVLRDGVADSVALQRYDIPQEDGSYVERYWSTRNYPVFGPDGLVTHIIHRTEDITELVQLREQGHELQSHVTDLEAALFERSTELQAKKEHLETLLIRLAERDERLRLENQHKDRFLAMLGHELRNPLAALSAVTRLVKHSTVPDASVMASMEVIERQLGHLTRLVDDLLDVARINEGRVILTPVPVYLKTLIDHALETTLPMIVERDHQFELELPDENIVLMADPHRFMQVLGNLLHNSAKYTPPGGYVRLRAHELAEKVEIYVEDNGQGISAELLPRIFDLFTQEDESLDRSQGGLGLGLKLVQQLVEGHGGDVEACSAGPGQGSVFKVTMPRYRGSELPVDLTQGSAVPEGLKHEHSAQEQGCQGHRILIVEDNADIAQALQLILEGFGYEVFTADDGEEALIKVGLCDPDTILLDIGLPGLDGYEVARRLRESEEFSTVQIIALTGYGHLEVGKRTEDARFDRHLVKPVDIQELLKVLEEPR